MLLCVIRQGSNGITRAASTTHACHTTTVSELCVLVSLLGFCLGTTLGWTSPMQSLLTSQTPPVGAEPLTEDTFAWISSINYLGTIVGTLFWGLASDRLGRKVTSCLVAVPYILSWVLILTARSATWLLAARFVSGLANSGTTVNVPAFISEVAQDDRRGFFGCFLVLFINIGILYSYILGAYLKYHGLAICALVIPFLFLITVTRLPESPVFLLNNGRRVEAEQTLLWYRGGDWRETEKTLLNYSSIKTRDKGKLPWFHLCSSRGNTKALVIGISLMFALQLSGIFTIISFAVHIFEMCGTPISPSQSAIVIAAVHLIFSCCCSFLVDRLGRKTLLIGPLVIIAVAQFTLGTYLFLFEGVTVNSALKWVPLVCLSLHVIAFATGLGPVPFVIKAEIFAPEVKGLALSQIAMVNGTLAFMVVKLFPALKQRIALYGCFWLYGGCCVFFAVLFTFYLPETKGKPQNIILKMLNNEEYCSNDDTKETKNLRKDKCKSLDTH